MRWPLVMQMHPSHVYLSSLIWPVWCTYSFRLTDTTWTQEPRPLPLRRLVLDSGLSSTDKECALCPTSSRANGALWNLGKGPADRVRENPGRHGDVWVTSRSKTASYANMACKNIPDRSNCKYRSPGAREMAKMPGSCRETCVGWGHLASWVTDMTSSSKLTLAEGRGRGSKLNPTLENSRWRNLSNRALIPDSYERGLNFCEITPF